MKILIISSIWLLSTTAVAEAREHVFEGLRFHDEAFVIDNAKINFKVTSDRRIIVQSRCVDTTCMAGGVLKQASLKAVAEDISQGRNPGAVICKKLGGKVVLGLDSKENQNSFCKFSDNSLIDNGTLAYYGLKHDH